MTNAYDRLVEKTAAARTQFLSIPVIGRALAGNVSRTLYIDFLSQAHHHVRHTCGLLSMATLRIDDRACRDALKTYIREERGHDRWILSDIAALRGDGRAIPDAPRPPCRAMVGYAYYAVEWISPYALFGMIHVLEGMSILLASRAAKALQRAFGVTDGKGFSYLASHGELDLDHVAFFKDLVNGLTDPSAEPAIIDCANMMYWLYGNIFHDLKHDQGEGCDAPCG